MQSLLECQDLGQPIAFSTGCVVLIETQKRANLSSFWAEIEQIDKKQQQEILFYAFKDYMMH